MTDPYGYFVNEKNSQIRGSSDEWYSGEANSIPQTLPAENTSNNNYAWDSSQQVNYSYNAANGSQSKNSIKNLLNFTIGFFNGYAYADGSNSAPAAPR